MLYRQTDADCYQQIAPKAVLFLYKEAHENHRREKPEIIAARGTKQLPRTARAARKHRQTNQSHCQIKQQRSGRLPGLQNQANQVDHNVKGSGMTRYDETHSSAVHRAVFVMPAVSGRFLRILSSSDIFAAGTHAKCRRLIVLSSRFFRQLSLTRITAKDQAGSSMASLPSCAAAVVCTSVTFSG